jgi:CDP-diglyceride synthetase
MGLVSRLYFNAVFGALGGLLGWMLFGIFGDPNSERYLLRCLLGGTVIGGLIGYFVVSAEALRDRSLLRFARLASYGVVLGSVGGALGMLGGEGINYLLTYLIGASQDTGFRYLLFLLAVMFARGLGWMVLGVAVGMSEGIAARSLGKFSYGIMGGALGGFLGGALYGLAIELTKENREQALFWGALGLMILGACIGSLSALVQSVFQPASLKVLRGWQEGREYPLDKPSTLLGRHEHADIALFRDMRVEKEHAFIRREGEKYFLVNNQAPPDYTRVNDRPVSHRAELHDGDRIQLGNVLLRFQMRAAGVSPPRKRRDFTAERAENNTQRQRGSKITNKRQGLFLSFSFFCSLGVFLCALRALCG